MTILPTSYFAPIFHYAYLSQNKAYQIEVNERFIKQSYRNRCKILGANGPLKLIIPLQKWGHKELSKEVKISYAEDWRSLHLKSIQAAYRSSPYFEYYEDKIETIFQHKAQYLVDFNIYIEDELMGILKIESNRSLTNQYQESQNELSKFHPKHELNYPKRVFTEYIQVFSDRHNFEANLSIIDLLFNLGPNSKAYLDKIQLNENPED